MTRLPVDLQNKIDELFSDDDIRQSISASLDELWDRSINVGTAQLARAIVFLSEGDQDKFLELRGNFMGDPRDLLVAANARLENSKYWFSEPFSKMGPLKIEPS